MFPQTRLIPKTTNFPHQALTPATSFTLSNFRAADCEASSSFHTRSFTALKLRTTRSMSVFCLEMEENTKDFPIGYSVSLSQESKQNLWKRTRSLALSALPWTMPLWVASTPSSLSIPLPTSSPLSVLLFIFFPTTNCFPVSKEFSALWAHLCQS